MVRAIPWLFVTCLTLAVPGTSAGHIMVATGSYSGTGVLGRNISGLGFTPDVVIVKGDLSQEAVIKTSTMSGNLSKVMASQTAASSNGITSLNANGFTVGNSPEVNQLLVTYHYVAFQTSPGDMAVGSYIGNGSEDRSIAGVGFQPGYMMLISEGAEEGVQRFPAQVGDASFIFANEGEKANRIQAFEPDGFELGNDNEVNGSNGDRYHYVAWRVGSQVNGGMYPGNDTDNRNILGIGFQPGYVIIKSEESNKEAIHRVESNAGDVTMRFDAASHFGDAIQTFLPDGFQVGTHDHANKNGHDFHWVAFYQSAESDLTVSVDVDDAFPNVGDTITYTIDFDNNGPDAASGLAVTDFLPPGLTYLSNNASQGAYVSAGGLWTVGTLTAGGGATLSITATVAAGTGAMTITNTASVSAGNASDPNPGNNTDTVDIVVQSADLNVAVNVDAPSASEGDTLTFTVSVANNGPHAADGVTVMDALPVLLSYVADLPTQGAYNAATGTWSIGTLAPSESATLSLVARIEAGAKGNTVVYHAVADAIQEDPSSMDNADSVSVQVHTQVSLIDEAGSLYPASAVAGQPSLGLRIAVDNPAGIGVTLDTGSTIAFSDSVNWYTARLANPTYVPPSAVGFTLTFAREAVPGPIETGRLYDLVLVLAGVTDETWPYTETIVTSGRNAILIEPTQVVINATILGDRDAHPGDGGVDLLSVELQNGYASPRTLDSLVVTNWSAGAGTQAQLDANISVLSLYDDADASGRLSAPDVLLASTVVSAARAVFDVAAWVVPASGVRRLVVAVDVDSTRARDGDVLDAVVAFASDVVFVEPTVIDDAITPLDPVDSYGKTTVDGMVAHQVSFVASGVDTISSGDRDVLLATIVIPPNGYTPDVLNALEIQDLSGGFDPTDFNALELYSDDGDGTFDPGTDAVLGSLVFSGDRFEISGLSASLTGSNRLFLVAEVALVPGNGDTFRPAIPLNGIEVQSGNDGPLDAPIVSTRTVVIRAVEKVHVISRSLSPSSPHPGSRNVPLLSIEIQNSTLSPVVLDSLALSNVSRGSGSVAELDRAIAEMQLYLDDGNGAVDPWDTVLAQGMSFTGAALTSPALTLQFDPGSTSRLLAVCDVDSFCVADGDTLAVRMAGAGALFFDSPQPVVGSFPMSTPVTHRVDGSLSHQVRVYASSDSLLITDTTNHLVFSFGLDGNGYAADTLTSLTLRNLGSADADHIVRLALYRDGGDGVFGIGAGDDVALGDFTDLGGNTYGRIGLAEPLPAGCGVYKRFFVGAEVNPAPTSGASIQFEIPLMGIEVVTGNDGPIDNPVRDPSVQIIPKPDELTVFPYSVGDKTVFPGSNSTLNFGIGFYNGFLNPVVLDGVELFQIGSAVSKEIVRVTAHADVDANGLFNPAVDTPVATFMSSTPFYTFDGLDLTLTPRRITYLFLAYDLSVTVRDSVTLDLQVNAESDLDFKSSPVVRGEFPLNSPGIDRTNGMIAGQIGLIPAPSVTVPPGESNLFVLGFTLPANGFLADQLRFVTVRSAGTAVAGQDLSAVNLWIEDDGDGMFDVAGDRLLATLNWTGSGWRNPIPLGEPVPVKGVRCYVTANVAPTAADDRNIQIAVPVNGIDMASGNDGPIDASVVNPGVQTISTDPLLSNLATDRTSYSVGQAIAVSVNVRNVGGTPLLGVHPSTPSVTGAGLATPQSGPVPASVDLGPGQESTFVWTFVPVSAGDASFCGNAFNVDSTEASSAGCSDPVTIQNRPLSVAIGLADVAPPGVDRGQQTVQAFRLSVGYTGFDSLSARASLDEVTFSVLDNAGSPVPPNSVLSAVTLVSTAGSNFTYPLADSTSNPVTLVLNSPITLAPGDSVRLDAAFDVSPTAALQPFRFSIDAREDVGVTDDNDRGAVPLASTNSFPWWTNAIDVADPADTLLVATTDTTVVMVNVGQDAVALWRGTLFHPGSVDDADEVLTDLTFDFFDAAGAPIAPSEVLRKLSIHAAGTALYLTETIPIAGNRMICGLDNVLLLPAQIARDIEVRVDLKSLPSPAGFFVTLAAPSSVQARDNNSGQPVVVAPLAPGAAFPMRSRTLRFEQPATGLWARRTSLAPPTILPAQAGVPIIRIALTHADTSAATIAFDSLVVELSDPAGTPLFPGDYFSRVRVMHAADTLCSVTALSSVSPFVECRFNAPVSIGAAASDSITVLVDAKSSFSPTAFSLRVEQDDIHAYDANDGSRVIGVAGSFPLSSEAAWLRLPGGAVYCGLASRIPPNASASETGIVAFDLDIDNRSASGYTSAEMRRLSVRIETWKGKSIAPLQLVNAAYLVRGDSVVATGVLGAADISFAVPSGEIVVAPDEMVHLRFIFDLAPVVSDQTFRFVLADAAATDFVDASTGAPVTAAAAGSGYPMATGLCHVLAASEKGGFTNFPNPFAAGREPTQITYFLEQPSRVTLRLYTLWGAEVATVLADAPRSAGLHQDISWSGRNEDGEVVNNGVYYLVLDIRPQSGTARTITRKVGVVR